MHAFSWAWVESELIDLQHLPILELFQILKNSCLFKSRNSTLVNTLELLLVSSRRCCHLIVFTQLVWTEFEYYASKSLFNNCFFFSFKPLDSRVAPLFKPFLRPSQHWTLLSFQSPMSQAFLGLNCASWFEALFELEGIGLRFFLWSLWFFLSLRAEETNSVFLLSSSIFAFLEVCSLASFLQFVSRQLNPCTWREWHVWLTKVPMELIDWVMSSHLVGPGELSQPWALRESAEIESSVSSITISTKHGTEEKWSRSVGSKLPAASIRLLRNGSR